MTGPDPEPAGRDPADDRELVVCDLLAACLERERVCPDETFVALGADPAAMTRFRQALCRLYQLDTVPDGLAGATTAAEVAARLRAAGVPDGGALAMVRRAWCAFLGRPEVGLDDDFFAQGGNSLAAARLVVGLAGQSGTRLPLKFAYQCRTIRQQALRLAAPTDGRP